MASVQELFISMIGWIIFLSGMHALTTESQIGALISNQRLMSDEPVRPECWNFTNGNLRHMEFYSPDYPNAYPNDIECVQVIEARRGYEVHLDFREKFIIEKSEDCKYDFLEIRDGPYGYSPLIGRFCGNEFPPYIKSSSRFLWIRFKSDSNVGKGGFMAVYSYYIKDDYNPKVEESRVCRTNLEYPGDNGFLSSNSFPLVNRSYSTAINCTWEIPVEQGKMIRISEISLSFVKSGDCRANFVEIYQMTTSITDRYVQLCSGSLSEFKSSSNRVYIRIYGNNYYRKPHMSMMYTVFNEGACNEVDQISCDGMCISNSLKCDGRNNCPSKQDESNCNTEGGAVDSQTSGVVLELHIIVLAAVAGFIFTVAMICIFVGCLYKRDKERKEKEAKKHQERIKETGIELSTSANTTLISKKGSGTSYYSLPRKGGGSAKDYHRNSLTSSIQAPSEGEYGDQQSDPGNYKRYMMSDQTFVDEETSPCPSLYNQGPVLTTIIERHDIPPQTNIDGTYSWSGYGWKPQQQHMMDTRSPVGSPPSLSENLAKLAQYTGSKNYPNIPEAKYYNPESKYEMYPDPRYLIGKEHKMKYGGIGPETEVSSPEQHRQKQLKLKSQHPDITRDLEVT